MPVSYLTFEINVYIQGYLFGKHAECALNEQKCIVCGFCFFTCPLQWIILSVRKNLAGWVRGVTGEVEAALKKMHLETSLEKNCFLGYIVSRIQKPSKVLSIYLIHSFIHLKEH